MAQLFLAIRNLQKRRYTTRNMFAPHCKVHGTNGKHINFELLLPCDFNRSMQHID